MPVLSEKTRNELKSFLPPKASYLNPVDTTAEVSPDQYKRTLSLLLNEDIDAVVTIYIPPMLELLDFMSLAIRQIAPEFRKKGIPLLASFLGVKQEKLTVGSAEEGYIPTYTFPESTAFALAKAYEYSERLKKPEGKIPVFEDINKPAAEAIIKAAINKKPQLLQYG